MFFPHLDRAETEKYIQSHLNYAGVTDRELFSRRAVDEIFRMSCGIPRLINRICEKSLMYGCQQNLQVIDDQDVLYVSDHEMISGGDQLLYWTMNILLYILMVMITRIQM